MNSTRMLRSLKLNERYLLQLMKIPKFKRTFLSESYQCKEAWNKRLTSPLLQKVSPVDFYLEVDQKYQSQKKIGAVDVDVYANCIKDDSHIDEAADILHKLRLTKSTSDTLDSTHHAVVRYYLSVGAEEQLLNILNDRLNYGIFCDHFCYNLLMDHFIKKQDFVGAAKVATVLMLQEDFEHPISNALAIYSCFKYLENPDSWQAVDPETLKDPGPKEEVKIRVKYLRNPYFDDHFDLWKPSDLVGKTLFLIGQTMNNPIGRSCHLRGLVLYRKYEDAIFLLKSWEQAGIKEVVYTGLLPLIRNDVPEIFEGDNEETKKLQQLLKDLEKANLCEGDLIADIENLIKKEVDAHSQQDILKQTELYDKWEEKRMSALQKQLDEIDRKSRLEKIEEMKKDLIEQERIITFFENEEKIELEIEKKLEKEKRIYGDDVVVEEDEATSYVPPEIVKNRQN